MGEDLRRAVMSLVLGRTMPDDVFDAWEAEGFPPPLGERKSDEKVTKVDHLRAERERLQRELADVEARLENASPPFSDPCQHGQVMLIRRRFTGRGVWYTYAAVNARGLYYLTGKTTKSLTWRELWDWLTADGADPGGHFQLIRLRPSERLL